MADRPIDPGTGDADLQELRALAAGRSPLDVRWEEPPESLWERIQAEADAPSAPAPPAEVAELDPRRRSERAPRNTARRPSGGWAPWLLGAAAGALVVAAVGLLLRDSGSVEVVASTDLELLGTAGRGRAELVDVDGSKQLRVEVEDLDAGDGFVEVWVIDTEVSRLVSLGPLRADGLYDLPDGLDPESFPVVDVSYEPLDGDPAHSGDSVLRGTLEF